MNQADGQAAERQTKPPREEDHFGVKGKAVDRRAGKDFPAARGRTVSTTLRVGHFAGNQTFDDFAEAGRGDPPRQAAGGNVLRAGDLPGPKTTSQVR